MTYREMHAEWCKGCSCGTWTRNCSTCNLSFLRAVVLRSLDRSPVAWSLGCGVVAGTGAGALSSILWRWLS